MRANICLLVFVMINSRFAISVGSQNAKGIHVRRGLLNKPEEFNVTIQPVFQLDKKCGMADSNRVEDMQFFHTFSLHSKFSSKIED